MIIGKSNLKSGNGGLKMEWFSETKRIRWDSDNTNFIELPIDETIDHITDMYLIPSKDILIIETRNDRKFVLFADKIKKPSELILRELVKNKLYSIEYDLKRNENV